jgi:Spy/CpxP family protein refolding chaperone
MIGALVSTSTAQNFTKNENTSMDGLQTSEQNDIENFLKELNLTYEQQQKLLLLLLTNKPNAGPRMENDRFRKKTSRNDGDFQRLDFKKRGERPGFEERFTKVIQELGITEEQKKQLEQNKQKSFETEKQLRKEIQKKQALLREEIAKGETDIEKIKQIHNEIKDLLIKKEDNRLNSILEVRDILSPEKFAEFHKKIEAGKPKDFRHHKRGGSKGFSANKLMK